MPPDSQNWPEAYEALDGKMPGCLGSACPTSCCGEKNFGKKITSLDGIMYRTSLMTGELEHQQSFGPSFEELGVKIVPVPILLGTQTLNLVNDCLGPNGCKLEPHGKKPMQCRIYPIGFASMHGPSKDCPAASDIIKQNGHEFPQIDVAEKHINLDP